MEDDINIKQDETDTENENSGKENTDQQEWKNTHQRNTQTNGSEAEESHSTTSGEETRRQGNKDIGWSDRETESEMGGSTDGEELPLTSTPHELPMGRLCPDTTPHLHS